MLSLTHSEDNSVPRRRIAIIGARGVGNYGGFETLVSELAPRLADMGYEVYCSHRRGENGVGPEEYKGAKLVYFPYRFPRSHRLARIFEVLYDWYFLIYASFVLRCGIIYCLGIASGPVLILARLAGSKTVVNLDGLEWKRDKFKMADKIYIRLAFLTSYVGADRLILDNRNIASFVPERTKDKSVYIPYGVVSRDCPAWNPSVIGEYLKSSEARIAPNSYWLVVARLEPDNNVHTAVRAYAKSRNLNPLVIVGNFSVPSYEDTVRSLVKTLPEGKAVYFLGSILNQDHLSMLRCHCIAYVHGHSVGGTNPSLLEAMSFKNTIIAHDNVFNRDVTEGFALFFKGVEDLAGAMDLVEQHRGDYIDLGAKVYEITRARFRWDEVASSYDALFRQL